jgi:hypothetical protein
MKLGCLPPKNAPALRLSTVLAPEAHALPAHPLSEDWISRFTSWQVLGNDQYGDCVAVTWANERRVLTALAGTETYPTMDEVIEVYKTQNPNFPQDDGGMIIQTLLEDLHKDGGPDGTKVVAFAKVDQTNLEEVKAALAVFGVVWTAVTVLDMNQQQFSNGQPWDWDPKAQAEGGHSIMSGGYLGDAVNDVRFITWGQETGFTDDFWKNGVVEAWVAIWPEHLGTVQFQTGVDLDALRDAYHALTGRVLDIPSPSKDQSEVDPED